MRCAHESEIGSAPKASVFCRFIAACLKVDIMRYLDIFCGMRYNDSRMQYGKEQKMQWMKCQCGFRSWKPKPKKL